MTEAIEIEKGDFLVTLAKKTISKKKSFSIKIALSKKFAVRLYCSINVGYLSPELLSTDRPSS